MVPFVFETPFSRRLPDPVFGPHAQRHIFMVPIERVPVGLPRDPNPRSPNINRGVWRDIARHLVNEEGTPNTFHVKNKGITIIAKSVERLDDDRHSVTFAPGDGIVDGGHTYELITSMQDELATRSQGAERIAQFVKIEILTGFPAELATEIAGGLNTAIQVQSFSLENLKGKFDWIRDSLSSQKYLEEIDFRENGKGLYDVRDILVLLDLFNIKSFPNSGSACPKRAYMSKSAVLENFIENTDEYRVLSKILPQILELHDRISIEAREKHNENGGKAASLAFVDAKKNGTYRFPFLGREGAYRLNGAALLPMLGAFRWMVKENPKTGLAEWEGGYDLVLKVWAACGGDLMRATQSTSDENGRKLHAIGRSSNHWQTLHNIVAKTHLMMTRSP